VIGEPSRATPRYLPDLLRNGTPSALSDTELLYRFASRRNEHDETAELAFAALLARHGPMVLRVCRAALVDRHDVEDAFQATFLVLAVRARSIRRRGSVAAWLHGVALRVAASERSRAARRRRHELAKAAMSSTTTEDAGSDPMLESELTLIVQEEVGRLPARYRAAVVLCYLEGLTHEMAAEHLGWPVGSVKSRLAWARERLRVRLTRRGVAPAIIPFVRSGSAADPEFAPPPCVVPATLADVTIRGALSAGLGKSALAGIVSAEAIALVEGVIKSMKNARLMLVAASVLFASLLTAGASVLGFAATRRNEPISAIASQNQAPQPAAAAPVVGPPIVRSSPAQDRGPLVIQAVVVDSQGRNLSGVDVNVSISFPRPAEGEETPDKRTVSDSEGRIRVEIARERVDGKRAGAIIWAYQPGRALARASTATLQAASPPVVRLTLEDPVKRTITVVGHDHRPIAGLRLVPRSLRRGNSSFAMPIPEGLLERLTVTTDAQGAATLDYLPRGTEPLTVQVAGPEIAAHTLSLADFPQKTMLKIGRTGRLVVVVRRESGEPLANISVAVWVKASDTLPSGVFNNDPPDMIRFGSQPLATGAQGAFQTPPALLSGSTYRVSIRQNGFAPFVSQWVTLGDDRTTIPPIRLRVLRKLTGQVHDREGRPLAGARVFLPAGGPSTLTDAEGRFDLPDALPDRTFVLVQQPGFRFQGWPVDPTMQRKDLRLTLVRTSEAPDRPMTVLDEPIPLDQARVLAVRVLEPYLQGVPEKANDSATRRAIEALSTFDLDRALDLFKKGFVPNQRSANSLRVEFARRLAEKDPAGAEALIEPIADPAVRIQGLLTLAKALPASKREQKRQLLERAVPLLRDMPETVAKIPQVAAIAEAWLDLGEAERAKTVLKDGLKSYDTLPYSTNGNGFLSLLMRLEPEPALARIQKVPTTPRFLYFADVAPGLTLDQAAEAEQFFSLGGARETGISGLMRLCRRLARLDPSRARRVAASLPGPGERVCAWAFVALGLAEKDQAGAREAIDQAIEGIDRLRELGTNVDPGINLSGVRLIYPTNPAALILPVVERIAPDRLAEVFWRAVALHPRIDVDREDLLRTSYIGVEAMLLARYDRDVATVLFEPMDSYLQSLVIGKSESPFFSPSAIAGKACLDPRAGVALLEALPAPRGPFVVPHEAQINLAEALGQPPGERWKSRWKHIAAQLPLED
jgi:RNA polymerase sigma factor (sigma-70 family)